MISPQSVHRPNISNEKKKKCEEARVLPSNEQMMYAQWVETGQLHRLWNISAAGGAAGD